MSKSNSIVDLTEDLRTRGFGPDEINEINLVARTWFEQKSKPYYFQITATDQESGNQGYFISTAMPKMARSNAAKGFIFLVD